MLAQLIGSHLFKNNTAREYYEKYGAKFEAERKILHSSLMGPSLMGPRILEIDSQKAALEAAMAWKSDYSRIVKVAELIGVPPFLIEAIGSMEGREYEDVSRGHNPPPPPASSSDQRVFAADAEVRIFLRDVSLLRNYARLLEPPAELEKVISGVPKSEYPSIKSVIPDVGSLYAATFSTMMWTRPEEILAFVIQSLCQFNLDIAAITGGPPWAAALRQDFVKYEMQHILRNQKLFALPGRFNWDIFDADDEVVPDQIGDAGEDVMDEILLTDSEEAPDDPFSGEGMDYDTSENNPNNEAE
jgi:hypothetical protein